jgi:hypothetical protein
MDHHDHQHDLLLLWACATNCTLLAALLLLLLFVQAAALHNFWALQNQREKGGGLGGE